MTLLSATFMLLGLLGYVHERQRQRLGLALVYLGMGTAVGMFAKENALLTPVYAVLIEVSVLRFAGLSSTLHRWLKGLYFGAPLAILILH